MQMRGNDLVEILRNRYSKTIDDRLEISQEGQVCLILFYTLLCVPFKGLGNRSQHPESNIEGALVLME